MDCVEDINLFLEFSLLKCSVRLALLEGYVCYDFMGIVFMSLSSIEEEEI